MDTSKVKKISMPFIERFEGKKLKAYLCPAGVWTIGIGSTENVKKGMIISDVDAYIRLENDIEKILKLINGVIKVPIIDNQAAALVSFIYNVGGGAFKKSTLLKLLNKGQYDAVPAQLMRWNRAGGKVLPGLTRRRAEEAALWSRRNDIGDMPQKIDKPKFFNK